jgi:hypothetical protein
MYKKFIALACLWYGAISYSTVDLTISARSSTKHTTRSAALTVTTHLGAGFFAEFSKVLMGLIHYEQEGLANVYVDWTDEFFPYKDEPHGNGWDLYFEPIQVDKSAINPTEPIRKVGNPNTHEIHDQICSAPWLSYEDYLPYRMFVHQRIKQYIRIKPAVLEKVDAFYNEHLKNKICIGVHVRFANAHIAEVPGNRHPTLEEYNVEVDAIIQKHPHTPLKIYVASDSHFVINHFKARYGDKIAAIEAYRAPGVEDPGLIYGNANYWLAHPAEWHQSKPGYYGGLTTLMDCLLLARCHYLVHTTSNVSNFVVFFNPTITSVYLPRTAPYVPCRHKGDASVHNKFLNPA